MNTHSSFDRRARRSRLPTFIISAAFASLSSATHAADGKFDSLHDVLTSREFLEDCLGPAGGTIFLSIDPTYGDEANSLLSGLREAILASGTAEDVSLYHPRDWETEAHCAEAPYHGPRLIVYITAMKDRTGEFSSARVVVCSTRERTTTSLKRGRYPQKCKITDAFDKLDLSSPSIDATLLPSRPGVAVRIDSSDRLDNHPRPYAPVSTARANGLLAAATVMAGTTIAFRTLQGTSFLIDNDDIGGHLWDGLAWTSSLGVAALGASSGAAWRMPQRQRRQQNVRLGVAGGISMFLGAAFIVTARLILSQSERSQDPIVHTNAGVYALGGFHAFGDLAVGVGTGMAAAAIHRRVNILPAGAGLAISGKF